MRIFSSAASLTPLRIILIPVLESAPDGVVAAAATRGEDREEREERTTGAERETRKVPRIPERELASMTTKVLSCCVENETKAVNREARSRSGGRGES